MGSETGWKVWGGGARENLTPMTKFEFLFRERASVGALLLFQILLKVLLVEL